MDEIRGESTGVFENEGESGGLMAMMVFESVGFGIWDESLVDAGRCRCQRLKLAFQILWLQAFLRISMNTSRLQGPPDIETGLGWSRRLASALELLAACK